jgi:translocator protein
MDLALMPATTPRPAPTPDTTAAATPDRHERRRRRRAGALVTAGVVATVAAGSVGVPTDTSWFRSLEKPRWYPPDATFGIVWTGLYTAIAWSSTRALNRAPAAERARLATTLATNLALNAAWTPTFFRAQRPGAALATVVALDASTLGLLRAVRRHDRAAGAALVPYLAWTLFATVLTEELWYRNLR